MTQQEVYKGLSGLRRRAVSGPPLPFLLPAAGSRFLDGVEVFNGNPGTPTTIRRRWLSQKKHGLRVSSGSDYHEHEDLARGGLDPPSPVAGNADLLEALKRGDFQLIQPA